MTLKKRLDRLEGATVKPETGPSAIVRQIVQPSATGPELVGLMLRPLHDGRAGQMDTLKRYRSKGQQTVHVERVTEESGGQAVVGNIESARRGRDEK